MHAKVCANCARAHAFLEFWRALKSALRCAISYIPFIRNSNIIIIIIVATVGRNNNNYYF